ncbi:MAG: deoxyribonuclease V [Chloroflexi bacterium]|nr:deoxyribonuclease V [Chloroflexota bacterium]MBU1752126.1 deoxyribonuclease V [Chloroflexota bacterium]MBU1879091.1 deoxyribonuclease V [Chloroflexota bacterium]
MTHSAPHPWDVTPAEAVRIQERLRDQVRPENAPGLDEAGVRHVAGVDLSVRQDQCRAAVVVLSYPALAPVDRSVTQRGRPVTFPYVPGLLSFREGPAVLDAWAGLHTVPDLIIWDGQGVAHPRRLGIAAHLGVILGIPSIGCAKSRLCGQHPELDSAAGSTAPLWDQGELVGQVVRTRTGVRPVFVSVGHLIDLDTAVRWVLACCRGYRLPETTRWAHRVAGEW